MNNDESTPNAAGESAVTDNASMSEADLISSFMGAPPQEEEEQQEETAETEETEETETEEESEDADEEEEENGETEFDIDSLTPEQLNALAAKARSKALSRYGELTKKIHDLESTIEGLKSQPVDPLAQESEVTHPAIREVKDYKELAGWKAQAEETEEWAQGLLDANGSADADEVLHTTDDGSALTKKQIIGIRNNARGILKKDIPAKTKELQQAEYFEQVAKDAEERIPTQIPAFADENSKVRKTHGELMASPAIQAAMKAVPAFKAMASIWAAHAANSIELTGARGKTKEVKTTTAKTKAKPNPPSTPGGVAQTPKGKATVKPAIAERQRAFEANGGSSRDLVALMAAEDGG